MQFDAPPTNVVDGSSGGGEKRGNEWVKRGRKRNEGTWKREIKILALEERKNQAEDGEGKLRQQWCENADSHDLLSLSFAPAGASLEVAYFRRDQNITRRSGGIPVML